MANKKISELTAADPLVGDEEVPVVQAGDTVKTTVAGIAALDYAPPTNITGTAYTLDLGDIGFWLRGNNAALQTFTVPADATTSFPIGTLLRGVQVGGGRILLAAASGVTINVAVDLGFKTRVQGSWWELRKVNTDEWDLCGDVDV